MPSRSISGRAGWLAVAGIFLGSALVGLWWLHRYRTGFPLDNDEVRYIGFSVRLRDDLTAGAIGDAARAWTGQGQFGPLVPLTSTPFLAVFGRTVAVALATQLIFFGALLAATFGLARRLSDARGGVLAAAVVAGTPGVIEFSRTYQFAIPAATLVVAATWALTASGRLEHRGRAVAWGVLLGLLPLTRTMTLAFLPAQVVIALWLALAPGAGRRARLVNLAIALAAGLITALSWLAWTWGSAWHYLTRLGYDAPGAGSGPRRFFDFWIRDLQGLLNQELYAPLAALLLLALILGGVALARRRDTWSSDRGATLRRWSTGDVAIVAAVLVEADLALASSANNGVGFRVPLLPLLAVLAVWALWQIPRRAVRHGLAGGLIAVALLNVAVKADVSARLSQPRTGKLPGVATRTPVIDGTSVDAQDFTDASQVTVDVTPDDRYGWPRSYDAIAVALARAGGAPRTGVVVGMSAFELTLSSYDIELAQRLRYRRTSRFRWLMVPPGPTTLSSAMRILRTPPVPRLLVTVSRQGFTVGARLGLRTIDQATLERAARALGYHVVARIGLPDGRQARVWRAATG